MTNEIKIIGVVGSGQMGSGIAQVAAMSGFKVWLYDISHEQLKKSLAGIEKRNNSRWSENFKLCQSIWG